MTPEMQNYWYRQSFLDDRAAEEKEQFLAKMLEYADEALMGKMEQEGDPPDGIVVEVRLRGYVPAIGEIIWMYPHRVVISASVAL